MKVNYEVWKKMALGMRVLSDNVYDLDLWKIMEIKELEDNGNSKKFKLLSENIKNKMFYFRELDGRGEISIENVDVINFEKFEEVGRIGKVSPRTFGHRLRNGIGDVNNFCNENTGYKVLEIAKETYFLSKDFVINGDGCKFYYSFKTEEIEKGTIRFEEEKKKYVTKLQGYGISKGILKLWDEDSWIMFWVNNYLKKIEARILHTKSVYFVGLEQENWKYFGFDLQRIKKLING